MDWAKEVKKTNPSTHPPIHISSSLHPLTSPPTHLPLLQYECIDAVRRLCHHTAEGPDLLRPHVKEIVPFLVRPPTHPPTHFIYPSNP